MRLSVVVCTRNRGSQLRACLASLGRLSCAAPWELVVVNNGSTDETG
jgi:glycosyltransferase involved in cell wall biosynthesis